MRMPHTGTNRGRRVKVTLKNGQQFVDQFHDRTDKYVIFVTNGRIAKAHIKSFAIVKGAKS